jgi:hypothetical protein
MLLIVQINRNKNFSSLITYHNDKKVETH